MFGFLNMTPEMVQRWYEREQERQRRAFAYQAKGMRASEAYAAAYFEMDSEDRDAIQEAKLADIRENGT